MKRAVARLAGFAVVVLMLLLPAVFGALDGGDDGDAEPTTITSYAATFDVGAGGSMSVEERLTVDFPVGDRHGIFRFFDTGAGSTGARRSPAGVAVTMDGHAIPFELLSERHGRYVNVKIGDPASTLSVGEHVFDIRYRMPGVLEEGTGSRPTQFYWDLVPAGWRQEIERSELRVHLPAPALDVRCAVGSGGDDGCTPEGEGSDTLVVRTGHLAANTPVTVRAGLDLPTPPGPKTLPWRPALDVVLGRSVGGLLLVLVLAGVAGLVGYVAARRARETPPPFPLGYAPPEGIGPAQAAYVLSEDVDEEQYVATLIYAAEKGAVELSHDGHGWTISDKAGAQGWAGLDETTRSVAHVLGGPGTSFTASPHDVEVGKRLKSEIESFERGTRQWAREAGLVAPTGLGRAGLLVVAACVVAVPLAAFWNPFDMTAVGLVPGLFAVFGIGLAAPGAGTKRTVTGRELWSRVGGFRRILSTPSAQDRFDFSGREELYTAYIPWAVAFGCAEEWAEKYRVETAAEPPTPSYLGSAYAGAYVGSASAMVDSFQLAVSSAISSYEATQSSSSSSGGGFSGGGGGGGGGGGSW